ncbi:hypothetical protein EMIHUDRAFT_243512 [Emiliania huxleyi CCMP1516]|uniref:RanBP2-type domain-containing protein n=2 Tax=Emiliania huxleyi TaxID=2903 RepID=A0A0D3J5E1_EMIH1|nr:hypothetical protein EMIHUDRAFT_243512 [Emiliania huxleyi CCMP1516]EOD18726.1 hypothetical protein EMIHUDRAFT_243512 [Emiliania huxleyi CCMP1516]|eukprot:XP_005771155.1 hypothetical protein EMIHUDRAFT_243512 [Emiliania huxleyi CCMP1516]
MMLALGSPSGASLQLTPGFPLATAPAEGAAEELAREEATEESALSRAIWSSLRSPGRARALLREGEPHEEYDPTQPQMDLRLPLVAPASPLGEGAPEGMLPQAQGSAPQYYPRLNSRAYMGSAVQRGGSAALPAPAPAQPLQLPAPAQPPLAAARTAAPRLGDASLYCFSCSLSAADEAFLAELEGSAAKKAKTAPPSGPLPETSRLSGGALAAAGSWSSPAPAQLSKDDLAFLAELESTAARGAADPPRRDHNQRPDRRGGGASAQSPARHAAGAPPKRPPARGRGIPIGGINGCPEEGKNGNWRCPSCFNINFGHRNQCNRCQTPRG